MCSVNVCQKQRKCAHPPPVEQNTAYKGKRAVCALKRASSQKNFTDVTFLSSKHLCEPEAGYI